MSSLLKVIANISLEKTRFEPDCIKINKNIADKITTVCLELAKKYYPEYQKMSDKKILKILTDETRIIDRRLPRLDMHKTEDNDVVMVHFQVHGKFRDEVFKHLKSTISNELNVIAVGERTTEFDMKNIDKSVPVAYVNQYADLLLDAMKYEVKPNFTIDAKKNKTFIVADCDGTLVGMLPSDIKNALFVNNLNNSAAKDAIVKYLELGGILVVCTGSSSQTTAKRLQMGIPPEKRECLSRLIVSGSGGGIMYLFDKNGKMFEHKHYRKYAVNADRKAPIKADAIFLGDDPILNDRPGFDAAGVERSVVVAKRKRNEIPAIFAKNYIGRNQNGTADFLSAALLYSKNHPGKPLFTPKQVKHYIDLVTDTDLNEIK